VKKYFFDLQLMLLMNVIFKKSSLLMCVLCISLWLHQAIKKNFFFLWIGTQDCFDKRKPSFPSQSKHLLSIVMALGQKSLTWVGSGQIFVSRVGSGQPSLVCVWVWKFFPKNPNFFNVLPFRSKNISLSQVKKYPDQSRLGLLFNEGQKYAWVGSRPISMLRCLRTPEATALIRPCKLCRMTHKKFL